ncbi:MAG TPA: class C beta-lactamase, partial [Telluria sp.]
MPLISRLFAIACAILPASAWAGNDAALRAAVDAAVRPVMAEYGIPGMAVAVTVDGRPAFFYYGVASTEQQTPVSADTIFELGSISKTFTATLAAYAQEQGVLSLDEHPGAYLPELRGSALDRATLRELGTYAAGGLPLQVPDAIAHMPAMLAWLQAWKPDAAPGAMRRYSNPSIGLLGHVTALAMHTDFAGAAEHTLFPQLGLHDTYVKVPPGAGARYAWGYNKANQPIRVNPGVFDAEAYGVKSTAADMLRFVQANLAPGQLPAPMRHAVVATQAAQFASGPLVQGLGWEQYPYPVSLDHLLAGNAAEMAMDAHPVRPLGKGEASGPRLFNKTGSTGGFGGYVLFVPSEKLGIVMLANKNYPNAARVKAGW